MILELPAGRSRLWRLFLVCGERSGTVRTPNLSQTPFTRMTRGGAAGRRLNDRQLNNCILDNCDDCLTSCSDTLPSKNRDGPRFFLMTNIIPKDVIKKPGRHRMARFAAVLNHLAGFSLSEEEGRKVDIMIFCCAWNL